MLKAKIISPDGLVLLVIGLSSENMKRLLDSKPIIFSGSEIGFPSIENVLIVGGETNDALIEQMKKLGLPDPLASSVRDGP